ncbi:MAG: DUF2933 domain-containing protein [Pseudomonadota bacterium]|nr:DUF2933 domain-containing protein [Nevskiales bacterium]MEC9364839.1 DUF2933 domain-containing protein [Pseudomonadota bacterium]
MNHDTHDHGDAGHRRALPKPGGTAFNLALAVLLGIGAYFLWTEHRAHLGSILLWGVLLACPLMHFFMHGSHGGHDDHRAPDERPGPDHAGHGGPASKEN